MSAPNKAPGTTSNLSDISPAAPLLLVGCGSMGSALLAGWRRAGLRSGAVLVLDPRTDLPTGIGQWIGADDHVRQASDLPEGLAPVLVFLAVKPQQSDTVLASLHGRIPYGTPLCSIAAGCTTRGLAEHWPDASIIRAMPNTPAQVGRGMTVYFGRNVSDPKLLALVHALFATCGKTVAVDQERLLDAVTAVSGSGPAYVFYLAEALSAAGRSEGLSDEIADTLARETIVGAAELLAKSDQSPSELRRAVTSAGGTTEAALAVLMDDQSGMATILRRAIRKAAERSRNLAR